MPKNKDYITAAEYKTGDNVTGYIYEDKELWGIRDPHNYWWVDDSGIVFHTEYARIAMIQADVLTLRAIIGKYKPERIQ